ncbi:MAG: GNAT family N-acetyltransferase [Bacteroidota bacterium]
MFALKEAKSTAEFETGAQLFKEYALEIAIDLSFQDFEQELRTIEHQYSRPEGALILAFNREQSPVGCAGIRRLETKICELKRMYIRQRARGLGLGKQLMQQSIQFAKELGYERMRLDTLPRMKAAVHLYESMGFYEIEPYRYNPIEGVTYMEAQL